MKKVFLAFAALLFAVACSNPQPTFDNIQTIEKTRSFTCQEYTATNAAHKTAGRATVLYFYYYYANGSNAYLGLSTTTTTLAETSAGYFVLGTCPTSTPDTTAPSVAISSPSDGATVSGTVAITANASDNVAVTKVEFYINGFLAGEDTTAPYSFNFDTTQASNTTHNLSAKAFDAAGNTATSALIYVNISNTAMTFDSIEEEDGYVKANSDGSSATVGTYATPAIGRGADGKFNRTFLSFNTSALPDGATITRAYVTITYSSKSGDPWANGNSLVVDAKYGTFGGGTTQASDFAEPATADSVANIASFSSGTKASSDFNAAGLAAINDFGMTQLRLRFAVDQTSTAYLFIQSGAAAKLTIEYSL